ncbi:MAG: hypothetical protein RIS86_1720 [Planctomycetota bacterium]
MKTLIWIIALLVLQAVFAAAAKKAKANQANSSQSPSRQSPSRQSRAGRAGSGQGVSGPAATGSVPSRPAATGVRAPGVPPDAGQGSVRVQFGRVPDRSPATTPKVLARGGAAPGATRRGSASARGDSGTGVQPVRATRSDSAKSRVAGSASSKSIPARPAPPQTSPAGPGGRPPGAPPARSSVAASIARVQAAEARIVGLPGVEMPSTRSGAATGAVGGSLESGGLRTTPTGAGLRAALQNPAEVRRAIVLSEVLGAPRSMRPYGA